MLAVLRKTVSVARALVLIGAPGAGKSSVLEALTSLLEREGVAYGAIESEQLSWGSPLLDAAEWIAQLAAVLELQRRAGREVFLVAATVESDDELCALRAALEAETALVVCLSVEPERAAARVGAREPDRWPGKAALVEHARELAAVVPLLAGIDVVIETDRRAAEDVAAEVLALLGERGLLER
jgi:thymidylate kinase